MAEKRPSENITPNNQEDRPLYIHDQTENGLSCKNCGANLILTKNKIKMMPIHSANMVPVELSTICYECSRCKRLYILKFLYEYYIEAFPEHYINVKKDKDKLTGKNDGKYPVYVVKKIWSKCPKCRAPLFHKTVNITIEPDEKTEINLRQH